jgi:hypothetical protein
MAQLLPYALFLLCPISMGVMMWMMMRPNRSQQATPPADPRIAELESQVNELRAALHARGVQEPESGKTGG